MRILLEAMENLMIRIFRYEWKSNHHINSDVNMFRCENVLNFLSEAFLKLGNT